MKVYSTEAMETVLEAVRRDGYHLYNVKSGPDAMTIGGEDSELAIDQEFVFKPDEGNDDPFIEVEVHFLQRPDGHTNVLLEFEFEDHSERFRNMRVEHEGLDAEKVAETVRHEFESAAE
jgi:sporulation-control protein spo0M